MFKLISSSGWDEAFKYAHPNVCGQGHFHHGGTETALPGDQISTQPFTREDVQRIIALDPGSNDGDSWLGVFLLRDGRYASLRAWCDYTGWG